MPKPVIRIKVTGDKEAIRKLRLLGVNASKVLEAAVMAGAEIVRVDAAHRAPSPAILAEIGEKSRTKALAYVGFDKDHWYYRFLETGTSPHDIHGNPVLSFTGRDGETIVVSKVSHPGHGARPMLRPAMDTQHEEAAQVIMARFKQGLGI